MDLCDLYERMPADDPGIAELGAGWTVFSGGRVEEGLTAFGALPGTARTARLLDLLDEAAGGGVPVAVRRAGGHVSLLEINGYHGADAARVADLSRHGTALSFWWNARGAAALIGASRGAVDVRVDPSLPIERPQREALARWADADTLVDRAGAPGAGWRAAGLAFVSAATGVLLDPSHWTEPLPCLAVTP